MKKLLLTASLLLTTHQSASAQRKISLENVALAASSSLAITGDWMMTRRNMAIGGYEMNPILGPHPSAGRVNAFCGAAFVGNLVLGIALPTKWRNYFWGGVTALESSAVLLNLTYSL